ncbi:hypothetical protein C8R48DRAFT_673674 [Suillus tomentosus]|nr:hypothetical protein C8R48DRAFT_673674 [Suillus tomentosus]
MAYLYEKAFATVQVVANAASQWQVSAAISLTEVPELIGKRNLECCTGSCGPLYVIQAIHPVDWGRAGEIVSEVKPLPAGCCLNALFDSCYSGSVLDLPYIYQPSDHLKQHAANYRALTKYPQAHARLK